MLLLFKKVHILLMVFFQQINHKDVTKFQMVCGIILYLFCFNKLHVIYEFIHMLSTAVKANERLYLYLSIYFGGGREEEWLVTLQNSRVSLLASYHKIIIQYLHYYSCSFTITCFHTDFMYTDFTKVFKCEAIKVSVCERGQGRPLIFDVCCRHMETCWRPILMDWRKRTKKRHVERKNLKQQNSVPFMSRCWLPCIPCFVCWKAIWLVT